MTTSPSDRGGVILAIVIVCLAGSCSAVAASAASIVSSVYKYKAVERVLNVQDQLFNG